MNPRWPRIGAIALCRNIGPILDLLITKKTTLAFDMFTYEFEGLVFDGKQRKKIESAT